MRLLLAQLPRRGAQKNPRAVTSCKMPEAQITLPTSTLLLATASSALLAAVGTYWLFSRAATGTSSPVFTNGTPARRGSSRSVARRSLRTSSRTHEQQDASQQRASKRRLFGAPAAVPQAAAAAADSQDFTIRTTITKDKQLWPAAEVARAQHAEPSMQQQRRPADQTPLMQQPHSLQLYSPLNQQKRVDAHDPSPRQG